MTDGRGNTLTLTYDALNRQVNFSDALNNRTTTVYDLASNVIRALDEEGNATTFTYDALNRRVLTHRPNGQQTTLVWDAGSNLVRTDVLASTTLGLTVQSTTFAYDALNRRAETVDARGGVTTQLYDSVSNLVGLVDASPQHNRHTMMYDALNREAVRIDPLGDRTTFAYDAGSLLVSKQDRNDRTCEYTFDALGRLAVETWKDSGGSTVNLHTFTYDLNSNTLTAGDFDGKYTFTYDSLDRAVSQQDMFGKTLTYTWDQADNRVRVEDSEGGVTTSVYDADNRLTSRQFSDPDQAPLREDFTYTARDQMASATRYSDVAGSTKVGSTLYTYDASMRVVNLKHRDASDTNLANYTYTYDVADRLTGETRNGTLRDYSYNATDELLGDGTGTFDYDLAGNRNTTGYVTGPKNQYLSDGVFNYFYDGEGNLDHKVRVSDGQRTTSTYDHRNQLTEVERAPASGPIDLAVEFKYDVFGKRIEEIADLDGSGSGSAVTTRFAYDGLHVWADLDGSSSLTTRRIFGDRVDEVLARISGSTVSWYLTDRLGSIREIADNTTGALIDEIAYGGFGNVESETTPASGDRYKFTGREFFVSIGLYDYRARTYDAAIGRFQQEDPIFMVDVNPYRYVGNGPTNATDPMGLRAVGQHYGGHAIGLDLYFDGLIDIDARDAVLGYISGGTTPHHSGASNYDELVPGPGGKMVNMNVDHPTYTARTKEVLTKYAEQYVAKKGEPMGKDAMFTALQQIEQGIDPNTGKPDNILGIFNRGVAKDKAVFDAAHGKPSQFPPKKVDDAIKEGQRSEHQRRIPPKKVLTPAQWQAKSKAAVSRLYDPSKKLSSLIPPARSGSSRVPWIGLSILASLGALADANKVDASGLLAALADEKSEAGREFRAGIDALNRGNIPAAELIFFGEGGVEGTSGLWASLALQLNTNTAESFRYGYKAGKARYLSERNRIIAQNADPKEHPQFNFTIKDVPSEPWYDKKNSLSVNSSVTTTEAKVTVTASRFDFILGLFGPGKKTYNEAAEAGRITLTMSGKNLLPGKYRIGIRISMSSGQNSPADWVYSKAESGDGKRTLYLRGYRETLQAAYDAGLEWGWNLADKGSSFKSDPPVVDREVEVNYPGGAAAVEVATMKANVSAVQGNSSWVQNSITLLYYIDPNGNRVAVK